MVHMVVLHIDLGLILRFFRRSFVGGEEGEEEGGDGRKPPMAELVDIMGVVVELLVVELVLEVDIEAGRRQVETQAHEVVVVGGDGGRNGARTPGGL